MPHWRAEFVRRPVGHGLTVRRGALDDDRHGGEHGAVGGDEAKGAEDGPRLRPCP